MTNKVHMFSSLPSGATQMDNPEELYTMPGG